MIWVLSVLLRAPRETEAQRRQGGGNTSTGRAETSGAVTHITSILGRDLCKVGGGAEAKEGNSFVVNVLASLPCPQTLQIFRGERPPPAGLHPVLLTSLKANVSMTSPSATFPDLAHLWHWPSSQHPPSTRNPGAHFILSFAGLA